MKKALLASFLGFSMTLFVCAEDLPLRDLRVMDATGQVTLRSADNSKRAVVLDDQTPLSEGDIIETGPRSTAELAMDADTVFLLKSNARLRISKMFTKNTQLEIMAGAVVAKVRPATSADQNLIFKMPTAVVAVRGTELAMDAGNGLSHVGVFDEGHVVVAGAWGHEHVKLGPHQETRVPLSSVPNPPYRLTHFRNTQNQLPALRQRVVYWHKNWKAWTPAHRQNIRWGLANPQRKPLPQFRHPSLPKPSPMAKKKAKIKPKHSGKRLNRAGKERARQAKRKKTSS